MPETISTSGPRRSDAIAIARVICIMGVVYVHAWTGANGEALEQLRGTAQENLRWTLMEVFGRSAVPLLGLISGWLMAGSKRTRDWRSHVGRKAQTILLPMILWNIIGIVLIFGAVRLFGLAAPVPQSVWWTIDEILIITRNPDINVQMPFLRDLFLCMLVAPLLVRLPIRAVAIVAALAAAAQIAGLGPPVLMRASILFFFCLGMIVRRTETAERIAALPWAAAVGPFVLLMAAQLYREMNGAAWDPNIIRALDLSVRVAAAVAFWRIAWALAGSPARATLLKVEPFVFLLFCVHLILIWIGGPLLGHVFGRVGSPLFPIYLLLQPLIVLGVTVAIGLTLRRVSPLAAKTLSGGRL